MQGKYEPQAVVYQRHHLEQPQAQAVVLLTLEFRPTPSVRLMDSSAEKTMRLNPVLFLCSLFLGGCSFVYTGSAVTPQPITETVLSSRYGLIALNVTILERAEEGGWERVVFRLQPNYPLPLADTADLGRHLRAQLEIRQWRLRCEASNSLPIFGGPHYTLRVVRGTEGAGLFLQPAGEPGTYRLEVGPTSPDPPPFSCPFR